MRDRIYNYMQGYRYKTRYRIQKNSSYRYKTTYRIQKNSSTDTKRGTGFRNIQITDTKRGTGFKKNQGTKTETKLPIRYRKRKNAILAMKPTSSAGFVRNITNLRYQQVGTYHLCREVRSRVDEPYGSRKFYLPEVKLGRSRGGGSGMSTGSCGDLFGRTAPLLGQASYCARSAETRRLRKT
jgi:hypothetical protein